MTNPVTAVPEALKLLNTLVERGGDLILGTMAGPWEYKGDRIITRESTPENVLVFDTWFDRDAHLAAASRSLVPAMVKGARAVLDEWETLRVEQQAQVHVITDLPLDKAHQWDIKCQKELWHHGKYLIALANAYRPALVELGWWLLDLDLC